MLAEKYKETVNQYIEKGHATKLTNGIASQSSDITNYIPHHAVTNPNKSGKIRVVFNAAAQHEGTSLNDKLQKGPDLLNSLTGLLIRFIKGKYPAIAILSKCFTKYLCQRKTEMPYVFFGEMSPADKI